MLSWKIKNNKNCHKAYIKAHKKICALVLAACLGVGGLAGCGSDDKKQTETASDEKQTEAVSDEKQVGSVYWLNNNPDIEKTITKLADQYTEETGVTVTIETVDAKDYDSRLKKELKKGKGKGPTMFSLDSRDEVDAFGKYAFDLTGTDVYNALLDDYVLRDEDQYAVSIGYDCKACGIIVNKVLLEKSGYSISEIKNFESLKKIADAIHKKASKTGYDAFINSEEELPILANIPVYYESEENNWFDAVGEISVDYLSYEENILNLCLTDSSLKFNVQKTEKAVTTGDSDTGDVTASLATKEKAQQDFTDGKAVFYIADSDAYDALAEKLGDDDLQMIPIYCGARVESKLGLLSYSTHYWSLNKKATRADKQATLDFMYWLVSDEEAAALMNEAVGMLPYTTAPAGENVFLQNARTMIQKGKTMIPWIAGRLPQFSTWEDGIYRLTDQYISGVISWEDYEQTFLFAWDTCIQEETSEEETEEE